MLIKQEKRSYGLSFLHQCLHRYYRTNPESLQIYYGQGHARKCKAVSMPNRATKWYCRCRKLLGSQISSLIYPRTPNTNNSLANFDLAASCNKVKFKIVLSVYRISELTLTHQWIHFSSIELLNDMKKLVDLKKGSALVKIVYSHLPPDWIKWTCCADTKVFL